MALPDLKSFEVWFVTGSQHLYGEAALQKVAAHSREIAAALHSSSVIPVSIVFKPVVTTTEEITAMLKAANDADRCIGLIFWMHTFSPAKMWINGLKILDKPFLHFHTQFNRDIPWDSIDMDFMNLNQSAHGDREFGFIAARMQLNRKVVAGHWSDPECLAQIDAWSRAAAAWRDWQGARFVRFGDNMRFVAVTEGDKVEAEMQFGYSVNTHGVGDLADAIQQVSNGQIDALVEEYLDAYTVQPALQKNGAQHLSLRAAAKIEIGLERFLTDGNYKGFTDTFEDLHGLTQLPGVAAQRLMAKGYGFAAEGDWKTAALVRAMKVMAAGLAGGNSFMEDYTYHFEPGNELVLGAHMLEICPTIADGRPNCEIHPLGIGGKSDPVRLVFNGAAGPALNASMVDLGNRFRLIVNDVLSVNPEHDLPNLPVARVLWKPYPNMRDGCAAWILAGGAHHTCFSQNLTKDHLEDFANMAGVEFVHIGQTTELSGFKNMLRWNEVYYKNR